ncbi:Kinesin-like protein kif27, partial [Physocladia obscura]
MGNQQSIINHSDGITCRLPDTVKVKPRFSARDIFSTRQTVSDLPKNVFGPQNTVTITIDHYNQQQQLEKQSSVITLTDKSKLSLPNISTREIYTAETVIEDLKTKSTGQPDSTYSIEEFTCLLAFGIQLNVDHPFLTRSSVSVNPQHSHHENRAAPSVTAEDIMDQVREKNLAMNSQTTYSMEEIISAFGIGDAATTPRSFESVGDFNGSRLFSGMESFHDSGNSNSSGRSIGFNSMAVPMRSSVASLISLSAETPQQRLTSRSSMQNLDVSEQLQYEMPRFEREIKLRMHPVTYKCGEYIIRKHEIGLEMYFLSKGTVEVVSGDGRTIYSIIHKGSFFGELGVLFNVPRTASVRAFEDCYCMVLTRENLKAALEHFPNIESRFKQVAERRMTEVKKMISYKRMLEFQPKMDHVT